VHPEAVLAHTACRHQVRTQGIVLRQVCSEIHLLPLEDFLDVFSPWEPELTQVPPFDKVNLPVPGVLVDFIWVSSEAELDLSWEQQ